MIQEEGFESKVLMPLQGCSKEWHLQEPAAFFVRCPHSSLTSASAVKMALIVGNSSVLHLLSFYSALHCLSALPEEGALLSVLEGGCVLFSHPTQVFNHKDWAQAGNRTNTSGLPLEVTVWQWCFWGWRWVDKFRHLCICKTKLTAWFPQKWVLTSP